MTLPKAGVTLVAEGVTQWLNQINTANQALGTFATAAANAANQINGIPTTGINNTTGAVNNLGNAAGQAVKKAGAFEEVWTGAFRQVGSFATQKMFQAFGAVSKFVTDIPDLAGTFQGKFMQILAVGGEEVAKNEDAIRKLIIKVGKELPISTNEAADAYANLIKGGFDPATLAAGVYTDTLQFALGANLDLGQAAELVAKQVGSFVPVTASAAEQAEFAAKAMDLITQAANVSTTNVEGLSGGLLQAGGIAKAVGQDYGDFVTTMAAIAAAFGSSAEAGTSYKNFLVRLNPSTKEAQTAMQRLGLFSMNTNKMLTFLKDNGVAPLGTGVDVLTEQVTEFMAKTTDLSKAEVTKSIVTNFGKSAFYDAAGNLKNMSEIAGLLSESLVGLTNEQKGQTLQQIFGNDAMVAGVKIAELGKQGFVSFSEKMAKANGVQKQYEAAMKGATFASDNFEGTLEAIQITLGTYILPYIEQFYTYVNELASSFLTLFDDKKTLNDIIPPGVIEAIQPLIVMFDDIKLAGMEMFTDLSDIFSELSGIFGMSNTGGGDILVGTFKLIFTAIALIVKAALVIIRDVIKAIAIVIKQPAVQFALNMMISSFQIAYEAIMGIVNILIALFNNDFGAIAGIIDTQMAKIMQIFTVRNANIYAQFEALQIWFGAIWVTIADSIMLAVEPIVIELGMWVMGVYDTLVDGFNAAVDGVMYVINNFDKILIGYFAMMAYNLGVSVRLIGELLVFSFATTWAALVYVFTDGITDTGKVLVRFGIFIATWVLTSIDNLKKQWSDGFNYVVKVVEMLWPKAKAALANFAIEFPKWIETTWASLKASFASIWDGKKVGKTVGDGILDGIKANADAIYKWMKSLGQTIIDSFLAGLKGDAQPPADTSNQTGKSNPVTKNVDTLTKSLNATATAAAFGAVRSVVNNIYNNSSATAYNLGVSTTATAGDTIQSFAIMGALAS